MAQIGPRASLILGMLVAQPQTADEIHGLLVRANADPDVMSAVRESDEALSNEWDTELAIRTLAENPSLVGDALERLHELAMVSRFECAGSTLWSTSTR